MIILNNSRLKRYLCQTIENLDLFFGLFGLMLSVVVIYLSYFVGLHQQDLGFIGLLACLIYLIFRKKLIHPTTFSVTFIGREAIVLNLIFITALTLSTLLLWLNLYFRPTIYFLLVSIVFATIALDILFLDPSRNINTKIVLFKIVISSFIFRAGIFYGYPSLIGADTWFHMNFARFIVDYGFIPTQDVFNAGQYNFYPIFHILISAIHLLLSIQFKNSLFVSVSLFSIIFTIFLYFIGVLLKNPKVGLLSMLLANISDMLIVRGVTNITTGSLVIGFFLIIVYLLLKKCERKSELIAISIFFTFVTIVTHQLTTFASLMLLIGFFVGIYIYKFKLICYAEYIKKSDKNISFTYILLFIISLITYWMNSSLSKNNSFFGKMAETLISVLTHDVFSDPGTSPYVISLGKYSTLSNILYHPGYLILLFFSIIGLLSWFSFIELNQNKMQLITSFIVSIIFIYGTPLTGFKDFLLPHRWLPFEYIFLVLFASQGMCKLTGLNKRKTFFVFVVMFVMTFFMITTPYINQDHPFYNQERTYRSMYKYSEIQGIYTTTKIYDEDIAVDSSYRTIFMGLNYSGNVESLSYTEVNYNRMVLLRKYLLEFPTQISDSGSLAQTESAILGSEYFEKIEQSHNKFYNNGEVMGYL